jgi:hypothetical protein
MGEILMQQEAEIYYSKTCLKRKFVLNENIFRSRDFGAENDVKYPGLNGNCLTRKRIKISLHTENFQSSGMHRTDEF